MPFLTKTACRKRRALINKKKDLAAALLDQSNTGDDISSQLPSSSSLAVTSIPETSLLSVSVLCNPREEDLCCADAGEMVVLSEQQNLDIHKEQDAEGLIPECPSNEEQHKLEKIDSEVQEVMPCQPSSDIFQHREPTQADLKVSNTLQCLQDGGAKEESAKSTPK